MSFGHWLKGATRIRFDDRTLGNLLKNGAVVGGTIVGGPLGLAIGAGGSALGQATLPGANIGDIAGAGLRGAANTGLAQAGKGLVSSALSHGASVAGNAAGTIPAPTAPTTPLPGTGGGFAPIDGSGISAAPVGPSVAPAGGFPAIDGSAVRAASLPSTPPPAGILQRALDAGKGIGRFAGNHDQLSAAALTTLGNVTDPYQHRLEAAEAAGLEGQNATNAYALQRQKAQDAALEPLREAIYGNLGTRFTQPVSPVAANPYGSSYGGGYG